MTTDSLFLVPANAEGGGCARTLAEGLAPEGLIESATALVELDRRGLINVFFAGFS